MFHDEIVLEMNEGIMISFLNFPLPDCIDNIYFL